MDITASIPSKIPLNGKLLLTVERKELFHRKRINLWFKYVQVVLEGVVGLVNPAAALQAGICSREVMVSAAANGRADVHGVSSAASTRVWVFLQFQEEMGFFMTVIKVIKSLTRREGRRGRNEREGQKRDKRLKRSDAELPPGRWHRRGPCVSRWEGKGQQEQSTEQEIRGWWM